MSTPLGEGQQLLGESGESYLVVSPMTGPKPGAAPNVWSAVDAGSQESVFILKAPGIEDAPYHGWPRFRSEMIMHELFKDNPHIRRQLDRIPPRKYSADAPALVLEPTETTLWKARAARPFTDDEITVIMRGALLGIAAIHAKNLVYADLKPDNIFVNGFRRTADQTTAENSLNAMIGDLGIVMEPAIGKVQPLVYRSPEVHFKSLITPKADIWSWGMIYCHLLQAQVQHDKSGLYDLQDGASYYHIEQELRRFINDDFDLEHTPFYSDCILPTGHIRAEEDIWSTRLLKAGVPKAHVDFLAWVLNPDPYERPSAEDILQHPHLQLDIDAQKNEEMRMAGIFIPALSPTSEEPPPSKTADTAVVESPAVKKPAVQTPPVDTELPSPGTSMPSQQAAQKPTQSTQSTQSTQPMQSTQPTRPTQPTKAASDVPAATLAASLSPSTPLEKLAAASAAVGGAAPMPKLKRAHSSNPQIPKPDQKRVVSLEPIKYEHEIVGGGTTVGQQKAKEKVADKGRKGGLFNSGLMSSLQGA
ncbi:uncharacterized protein K452DRAFT_266905 [Aplosporella prunicola CBS 121167]|uniref:Protein kinase domain-containing protein n=1 Tax=Aplosporella prunicola CBS 121167 TaxID=1176127 RepID=A0A6A6BL81_9PEZI|nr:uncharacterized protein K452DRAFT_266905 [Aplosporella prunicola CBS 121167]KAF2144796.1 hypothetical protein K452DRAFT_266905 [Aplosporella prunicola CBS 121167]